MAQASLKLNPLAGLDKQPELRHSCLKVHFPTVPKLGALAHWKRIPGSPALAGNDPPHTAPCRWLESPSMSAGRGCAVIERDAEALVPFAEAVIVAVNASPL